MNELQIFNYRETPIRTVQRDNEMWWVLKDVCEVLGLSNPTMIAERLEDDEKAKFDLGLQGGATNVINESGLYSVILRSDKPEAKPFRKWVTGEVLPTIRKTGGYVNNDEMFINTYLPNLGEVEKAAFRQTLQTLRAANEKIERDAPKVLFAEAVTTAKNSILIGELAKILRQNGVEIGQNRLFEWLRNNGYLVKRRGTDYNAPTQRSIEAGLFTVKETVITRGDGSTEIKRTTKVTGKGQLYFINRFLKNEGARK